MEPNMSDAHRVTVHKLYAEDVFDMFYNFINRDGGDGGGAIICANPEEAINLFVSYIKANHHKDFPRGLYLDKYEVLRNEQKYTVLNYHDNNENFIFTNDPTYSLDFGDIVWFIESDCYPGFASRGDLDKVWLKGMANAV
jgi:hypothetical protein